MRRSPLLALLPALLATALIAVVGAVAVIASLPGDDDRDVLLSLQIDGASMEPTLLNGEKVDVLRYERPVQPGDLIAFRLPTNLGRTVVKRVIAGPGQTIEIGDGIVMINGSPLNEPYVRGATDCTTSSRCSYAVPWLIDNAAIPSGTFEAPQQDGSSLACDSGCYYVLGDNRPNSADSRQGWLVPVEYIIGYVEAGN